MVNSEKIKARAKELGVQQADIAAAWGVTPATASRKINNKMAMYLHEAEILIDILQIGDDEFGVIFFCQE